MYGVIVPAKQKAVGQRRLAQVPPTAHILRVHADEIGQSHRVAPLLSLLQSMMEQRALDLWDYPLQRSLLQNIDPRQPGTTCALARLPTAIRDWWLQETNETKDTKYKRS